MGFLKKLRKILTKITDLLLVGREQGWWDEQRRLEREREIREYKKAEEELKKYT